VGGLGGDDGLAEGGVGAEGVACVVLEREVAEAEEEGWRLVLGVPVGGEGPLEGADERGPGVVGGGCRGLVLEVWSPRESGAPELGWKPVVHVLQGEARGARAPCSEVWAIRGRWGVWRWGKEDGAARWRGESLEVVEGLQRLEEGSRRLAGVEDPHRVWRSVGEVWSPWRRFWGEDQEFRGGLEPLGRIGRATARVAQTALSSFRGNNFKHLGAARGEGGRFRA